MSKLTQALKYFDLEIYLHDHCGPSAGYADRETEIRFNCPFCVDRKGKFYVNIQKKTVFCQRCKYGHGVSIVQFMADIEGVPKTVIVNRLINSVGRSYGDVNTLVDRLLDQKEEYEDTIIVQNIDLPAGSRRLFQGESSYLVTLAENYVRKRGLTDEQITNREWYLGAGTYRNRLIIPVHKLGCRVHWIARGLRDQIPKYLTPPGNRQALWLYNWDRVQPGSVVLVEGVFDALAVERAGIQALAAFGKEVSHVQADQLRKFEDVIILFDADAVEYAYRAATLIDPWLCRIGILDKGDPGTVDKEILRDIIVNAPIAQSPEGVKQYIRHVK